MKKRKTRGTLLICLMWGLIKFGMGDWIRHGQLAAANTCPACQMTNLELGMGIENVKHCLSHVSLCLDGHLLCAHIQHAPWGPGPAAEVPGGDPPAWATAAAATVGPRDVPRARGGGNGLWEG